MMQSNIQIFPGCQKVKLETGTKSVEPSAGVAMATDLCNSEELLKSLACICKDDIVQFESDQNRKYTCGGCLRRFITVCGLHDHLKLHGSGGSYHFDHVSNTAFPKYDTFCSFTQTDMDLYEGRADAPVASLSDPGDDVSDNYDQDDNVSEHLDQEITVPANTDQEITVCAKTDRNVNVSPLSAKRNNVSDKHTKVKAEKDSPIKIAKVVLKDFNESVKDAIKKGLMVKGLKVTDSVKRVPVNDGKVLVCRPPRTLRKRTQPHPKLSKNLAKKRKEVVIDSDEDFEVDTEDMDESEDEFHDRLDHSRSRCYSEEQTAKQKTNCKIKVEHQQKLFSCKAEDESNKEKDIEIKCEIEVKNDLHEDNQTKLMEKTKETFALTQINDLKPSPILNKWKQSGRKKKKKRKGEHWPCEICNRILTSKFLYERHQEMHSRKPKRKPEDIIKRQKILTAERIDQLTCKVCYQVFRDMSGLKSHTRVHLRNPDTFTTQVTNLEEIFERPKPKKLSEEQKKLNKLATCEICKKVMSKYGIERHMLKHTRAEKPNFVACKVCKKVVRRYGLKRHMLIHTNQADVMCEQCGQSFINASKLRLHQFTHKEKKPWPCTLCPAQFTNKTSFNVHMANHRDERPHVCNVCDKAFITEKSLRKHVQVVHMGIKRFACEYCGRRFPTRSVMVAHQVVHFAPTLECRFCDKKFKEKVSLKRHERIHTGHKMYQCHICDHGFNQCTPYFSHMDKRHGLTRPFLKAELAKVIETNKRAGRKDATLMLPRDTDNVMTSQLTETEESVRNIISADSSVGTSATACDYGQIIKTEVFPALPLDDNVYRSEGKAHPIVTTISSGSSMHRQERPTKMLPSTAVIHDMSSTVHQQTSLAGIQALPHRLNQVMPQYKYQLHRDFPGLDPSTYSSGQHQHTQDHN